MMDIMLLHKFFAGSASYAEEEEVCNWVEKSEENMEQFQKERKLYDAVLFSAADISGKGAGKAIRIRLQVISIAAAICLFAIGGFLIGNHNIFTGGDTASVVVVPPTERTNVILPDGTSVWLNSGSTMSYPSSFSRKSRSVILDGEANFEVVKDPRHPFIVHTAACNLKVRGTKFNVKVGKGADSCEVALFEGAVELLDRRTGSHIVSLAPMQKVTLSNGGYRLSKVTDMNDYRWKDGLICLDNEAFPEIMEKLGVVFGVRIEMRYGALSHFSCSGKFRISDGLDYILQVLQRTSAFSFSRSENGEIVYIDPPEK